MKRLNVIVLSLLSIATLSLMITARAENVVRSEEGFYFGGQLGGSNTHNIARSIDGVDNPVSPSNTGIAGRLFLGYMISSYVGMETGFTHYHESIYSVPTSNTDPTIQENGFDIVGKAVWPMGDFSLFVKAGGAFIQQSLSGRLSSLTDQTSTHSSSTIYARPTAAVGLGYNMTPNWVADVTASRVFAGSGFENADLIAVGLSYHFVTSYCGQFLC